MYGGGTPAEKYPSYLLKCPRISKTHQSSASYRDSSRERIKRIPLKVLLSFKGKALKVRLSLKGKEVTSTPYFLWIKKGARHVTLNDFSMSAIVLPPSRDAFL